MFKVSEIAKQAQVRTDDCGYIASYDGYIAEGGTRNEALNNPIDTINAIERTWPIIQIRLFARSMRKSRYAYLFEKFKVGIN